MLVVQQPTLRTEETQSSGVQQLFRIGAVATLLIGTFLRFYRLGAQALWLDELYIAELVRGGISGIWRTAFVDVLPPLSTLPFWLAVRIGGISALSLRAVSVVASLVALLVFYRYCMLVLSRTTALLATGLFAIAPLAVYYAQEARPYALGLMGALLTLLAYERLCRGNTARAWALYATLAVVSGQLYYLNVVLVGAQLLAMLALAHDRRRILLGAALTIFLVAVTLGPFAVGAARVIHGWRPVGSLRFLSAMQTMVAGDVRIAPANARVAALATIAIGLAAALASRYIWRILLPHVLQVTLAVLVSFVLLPLIGKPAPSYDERAFLMILPSVLIGFSIGIQQLNTRRAGRLLAIVLVAIVSVTSFVGLSGYFGRFIKSPEGELAEMIGDRARPGDIVITSGNAYSVDATLRFYEPDLPVYRYSHEDAGHWFVVPNPSVLIINRGNREEMNLDSLTQGSRLWLVQRESQPPYFVFLLTEYQVCEEFAVVPFQAFLLERR